MSGTLSQGQMASLQNYLDIASIALQQGDVQNVVNYLNQYYDALSSYGSGYASLARSVVDNTGVYGQVANLLAANAIGAQNWQNIRLNVAVSLAQADYTAMKSGTGSGGVLANAAAIDLFHADVFPQYGLPLTSLGLDAYAALGLGWSGGAMSAVELAGGQSQSPVFTGQDANTVAQAMHNLFAADAPVLDASLNGDVGAFTSAVSSLVALSNAYNSHFGISTPFDVTQDAGRGVTSVVDAQAAGGIGAIVLDLEANGSVSTGSDSIVAVYADNVIVTNTGSNCTDGINCSGVNVNSSNNSVDIGNNSQANVSGSGDQITAAAGDLVGVYGGANTISAQGSDHLYLSGTAGNFDEVSVSNANPASGSNGGVWLDSNVQANVTGDVNTVAVGTGDSVGVYGASNTVNVGADAFVVIGNTGGGGDAVNASGDMSGGATANGQPTGIAINVGASANVGGGNAVNLDLLSGLLCWKRRSKRLPMMRSRRRQTTRMSQIRHARPRTRRAAGRPPQSHRAVRQQREC